MLRSQLVPKSDPDSSSFVYVLWHQQPGDPNHGVEFWLPYIKTRADAAKLVHEMEGCIKVLDAFILEDLPE
jgi:hypothetical protein